VGRLYKPISCWSYAKGLVHEYPVLKLRLLNLLGESIELELPIDTGFEGAVMLDYDTYSFFAVGELPAVSRPHQPGKTGVARDPTLINFRAGISTNSRISQLAYEPTRLL